MEDQRTAALQKANTVRVERKKLKRRIAVGEVDARELLAQPPDVIHTAKVIEFLTWCPKVGKVKARRICARAGLHSPTISLSRLGDGTRARIAELLPS